MLNDRNQNAEAFQLKRNFEKYIRDGLKTLKTVPTNT